MDVDISSLSPEQIASLLAEFGLRLHEPASYHKCYGGFSGSNYACTLADGRRVLLKQTNDQAEEEVEAQVAALLFLRGAERAPPTCYPWPLEEAMAFRHDAPAECGLASRYMSMTHGSPAIVLDFLSGRPANNVLVELSTRVGGEASILHMFAGLGEGLGRLHSVGTGSGAGCKIRDVDHDRKSACMLGMQAQYVQDFKRLEPESLRSHPFVALHAECVPELQAVCELGTDGRIPRGILHGDPFLDNILVSDSGDLVGFVDWEDVCIGPLLFDVGCLAIGTCYRSWGEKDDDNTLDVPRLKAMLEGYCRERALTKLEGESLISFMHTALLCNATWRWRNFNVVHPEVEAARDSYRELADRLVALKVSAFRAALQEVVDGLPTAADPVTINDASGSAASAIL
ncbi:phosphotransferase [bacterium]|nr:phosphotransferase [bacterium]